MGKPLRSQHTPKSLPPLSFGDPSLDEPANDTADLAAAARAAVSTRPPPANDGARDTAPDATAVADPLESLTFGPERGSKVAPKPAPVEAPRAAVYEVPSLPPPSEPDPSFSAPKEPSVPPPPKHVPQPLAPPPPSGVERLRAAYERATDALVERLPEAPAALRSVPPAAVYAVALVLVWAQVGVLVHTLRTLVRVLGSGS